MKTYDVHSEYDCPEHCLTGVAIDEVLEVYGHHESISRNRIQNMDVGEFFDFGFYRICRMT